MGGVYWLEHLLLPQMKGNLGFWTRVSYAVNGSVCGAVLGGGFMRRGLVLLILLTLVSVSGTQQNQIATGYVYHDRNGNGQRDPGEEGLPNVRVSNQRVITVTDKLGRWTLPHDEDTIFFVIKPRGWTTRFNEHRLPQFYYIHKPAGSPPVKYGGVPPTGPLPQSVDFGLRPQREPNRFRAVFFGDPQPRDQREIDYITHDVIEGLIGVDASFGVTLGDVMFDDLSLFESLNSRIALIGIPWYNVLGNHDINFDAESDRYSDETWERVYGPSYYSFDYGPTHFIVLDDVVWTGRTATDRGRYKGGLGKQQMDWIKADLARVPKDQLVVLLMHIPLVEVEDRQELYRLIEKRPYALSVSAHTHYQEHKFIGKEDGWQGAEPHHHVINVTVSGSWWSGRPDERGIPHTTMRDGAPNGYSIFNFDGNRYSIEFFPARRPADYQMNIYSPEAVAKNLLMDTAVQVNFFTGNERSRLEMKVGNRRWREMTKVDKPDPEYAEAFEMDSKLAAPYRTLPKPINSPHLWEAQLPADLPPGTHQIDIRARDMFGKLYTASRVFRVTE
jgi:hypothetical protein